MICQICNFQGVGKAFSNHLQSTHKLSSLKYTIDYLHGGVQPQCENCGKETRYVSFSFKRFCKNCAVVGSSIAGKKGGQAPAWNKGKTKKTDPRLLKQSEKMRGENNPFFGKSHTEDTINKMRFSKIVSDSDFESRISERDRDFDLITSYEEYFSRQKQHLEFRCKKCGITTKKTLQAFERGSSCPSCNPVGTSQAEKEIGSFIESLGLEVEYNDRSVLSPKEIDVYVPSKKIGIEHNGLYYHSILNKGTRDRHYYLNKKKKAKSEGVSLIHFFSDEWLDKRDICESMIKNRLGLIHKKIFARKCVLREVSSKDAQTFFKSNHISGYAPSSVRFGLYYENELVLCLSLRKPRQKKYKDLIEISRFASKINTNVAGGLSKILTRIESWARSEGFKGILTYADLRFGEGSGYQNTGFVLEKETGPDYWYSDGRKRFDRFKFRASNGKSEKIIASENNVFKIWGCGSNIFIKNIL